MLIRFGDRELFDISARRLLCKYSWQEGASRAPQKLSLAAFSWTQTGFAQRRPDEAEPKQKRSLHAKGGVRSCVSVGAGVLPSTLALLWRRGGCYQLTAWKDLRVWAAPSSRTCDCNSLA